MSRDTDGIIKQKFAETGDVGLGGLALTELWPISYSTPGGPFPQRIQFNQLFRYLSALGVEINEKGPFLEWDGTDPEGPDYEPGAVVLGTDDNYHICLLANGPSSTIQNPVGDISGKWTIAPFSMPGQIKGAIDGLAISNGTDSDHDIDIATGSAGLTDGSDHRIFELDSSITKRIDANWAAGSGAGGFPSGLTLAADTMYYFFMIGKSDGTIDFGFDTSTTAADLLADATGYTWYRAIMEIFTDSSSNIINGQQVGDTWLYDTVILDISDSSGVLLTFETGVVTVPPSTEGVFAVGGVLTSASQIDGYVTGLQDETGTAEEGQSFDHVQVSASTTLRVTARLNEVVDASSQLKYTMRGNGAWNSFKVRTYGFISNRGRDL